MANVIVVGYDGAEGAKAALEESLWRCSDLGAELVAVFGYGMPIPERQSADYRETLQELGEKFTAEALERRAAGGREGECGGALPEGGPGAGGRLRRARRADDRRGLPRPLAGALLGSVPHRLVQLSEKPVLVVRR